MTIIYHCTLELHDSLYFATREIGRLYETEPVVHNYALAYILGFVDSPKYNTVVAKEEDSYRYFCAEQIPKYEQQLTPLNQQGIYITPAKSIRHTSVLNTWKYADNHYHVKMKPTSKNIPSFGRTKEIAPESEFNFFVIAQSKLDFPKWVRMGKWASKAELKTKILEIDKHYSEQEFTFSYLLNPLDVMTQNQVLSFDTINMPPVSLLQNIRMIGDYFSFKNLPKQMQGLKLPSKMSYQFTS
ncbi:type I-D CRISPR-associated protein Cas5/Csc1 [[Limnothrix rosea] IAM M-220]|uniref:type I-D CRISPR-associated protein Cas5/Csc1 n=1 Tax=[Limnothrix rosea] IAM M-220 TaxID=454133 RepID=UPI000968787E|nr:type I-D CRISPR-associated protein Cas5/Csc1 [[Limnothrix rosea] IAM M-220]OKH17965.1 type I-D CRISPR-associated protein Cas5/Csc1 [[Limnothrix rosea] IAM M-220]